MIYGVSTLLLKIWVFRESVWKLKYANEWHRVEELLNFLNKKVYFDSSKQYVI